MSTMPKTKLHKRNDIVSVEVSIFQTLMGQFQMRVEQMMDVQDYASEKKEMIHIIN